MLELLGVEPELGAAFTMTFEVDGHETTQTFTLCGWWEYDEAIVAKHILIPESRVDAILDEVGVAPPGDDGMTGTWNLDVMLRSSMHIAQDLNQFWKTMAIRAKAWQRGTTTSAPASTGAIPARSFQTAWTSLRC
ncbi:MAG: hypothetical protein V8R75_07205 [Oscillospiraceae bacterium]